MLTKIITIFLNKYPLKNCRTIRFTHKADPPLINTENLVKKLYNLIIK